MVILNFSPHVETLHKGRRPTEHGIGEVIKLKTRRHSLTGRQAHVTFEINKIATDVLPNFTDNQKTRELTQKQLASLETDLVDIEEVTKLEFLNLLRSVSQQMKDGSPAVKDVWLENAS